MNMLGLEMRKIIKGVLIWGILLGGILLMYLAFFPSMKDSGFGALVMEKIDLLPKELLQAINLSTMPDFSNFIQYFAYVYQFIILGACIFAMMLGCSIVAREENGGTIEYLMSNPIGRDAIISVKLVACILSTVIVGLIIFAAAVGGGYFFTGSWEFLSSLIMVFFIPYSVVFIYLIIGFTLSTFASKTFNSIGFSLGLFFGTYVFGMMANVVSSLRLLKWLSPINYATPTSVLQSRFINLTLEPYDFRGIYVGLAIMAFGIILSYIIYCHRDLKA